MHIIFWLKAEKEERRKRREEKEQEGKERRRKGKRKEETDKKKRGKGEGRTGQGRTGQDNAGSRAVSEPYSLLDSHTVGPWVPSPQPPDVQKTSLLSLCSLWAIMSAPPDDAL